MRSTEIPNAHANRGRGTIDTETNGLQNIGE